jgi:hypothetical protein
MSLGSLNYAFCSNHLSDFIMFCWLFNLYNVLETELKLEVTPLTLARGST